MKDVLDPPHEGDRAARLSVVPFGYGDATEAPAPRAGERIDHGQECGMRRTAVLVVGGFVACGLVASAGCGHGSSVESVAAAYFHDLANHKYQDACTLFSDDLRRKLGDCPATLRRHRARGLLDTSWYEDDLRYATVTGVHTKGDTAEVTGRNVLVDKKVKDKKTGKIKTTRVRTAAVSAETDGKGITLVKVGDTWKISGGGI
jgi:hypothetical protein